MVVNQWHILSRGFEDALKSKWVRLYFFSFHISCVIISLNIFTAFIIEAFLLEYETEDSGAESVDSKLEKRIKELGLAYEGPEISDDVESPDKTLMTKIVEFFNSLKEILNEKDSSNENNNNLNGFRFHINSKEAKPVEILLQRMFLNEIDISIDSTI
ncbi:unnamed protein product [Brachionus calyciflorus]|uniref:Uncharacterized protein n=1 Tax=Brachionus calyciflorus TaxID=104777 RepID=A0A813UB71_9BILA|nr:unnamed protein product [Brachionus calyciflorus]